MLDHLAVLNQPAVGPALVDRVLTASAGDRDGNPSVAEVGRYVRVDDVDALQEVVIERVSILDR